MVVFVWVYLRIEFIALVQQLPSAVHVSEDKLVFILEENKSYYKTKLHKEWLQSNYHSFDWVEWQERENGIYVKSIYSPLQKNVIIGQDYLEPGDRLLQVENKNVPDLYVYRQIMRFTPPTLFLRCKVLKGGSQQNVAHYYILYGYRPLLAGTHSSYGYKIFFYLNIT